MCDARKVFDEMPERERDVYALDDYDFSARAE